MYGQFWNAESHPVLPNAVASEPSWWTDFVDTSFVSDQAVENQVRQESQIASAGVSLEMPGANDAETCSREAAFQTTCEPFGFCQQPSGLNVPANSAIEFEQNALSACSDDTNSMIIRNSISPTQPDWNFTSSSAPRFDCDLRDKSGRGLTPFSGEPFCQETQEKRKSQIPRLNPFRCPHCAKRVPSGLSRYVLLLYIFV